MFRFFLSEDDQFSEKNLKILNKETIRHFKTARIHADEKVEIVTGGKEYVFRVEVIDKNAIDLTLELELETSRESNLKVDLFQCTPKSSKMDLIIQKNVELGVHDFIIVNSRRCVSKFTKKDFEKKQERWGKIALEAAKQSKRNNVPAMRDFIEFEQLSEWIGQYDLFIVLYESEADQHLRPLIECKDYKKIGVLVGPEGGFDPSEIEFIEEQGGVVVTLGKRILRTETAGFTALTCLQYELGDI